MSIEPIGVVESPLTDPSQAPRQGTEGGPDAWLVVDPRFEAAIEGLKTGDRVVVLTWLHRADRDILRVHPRDNPDNPMRGVFATRSQDRPNPIGLHEVEILAIEGRRLRVSDLEAIDGTPILDVKIAL